MIALLGALLGFLGSVVPDVFKLYKDKKDREHELRILEMQLRQQAQGHSERLAEIDARADIAEAKTIYSTYATRIGWVDALNGTVRPVLAYGFFLLYATVKWLQWQMLPDSPLPWQLEVLWGEEDKAIFAAIIAFYYGARAMKRARS